jgi:hypothetical protein
MLRRHSQATSERMVEAPLFGASSHSRKSILESQGISE